MRGTMWKNRKAVEDPKMVEQWEAVLMPWLDALSRAALHCKIHTWATVSDMENLWLAFRVEAPFRKTEEAWVRCMEAMELLELLARVDKQLAWDLLINRTVRAHEEWLRVRHNEIPVLPRFKLLVDDCKTLANDEDVVFQRLLAMKKPLTSHSSTYGTVKQKLLEKWTRTHGGKAFDRKKEGRVGVLISLPVPDKTEGDSMAAENFFTKIEQLVAAHHSSQEIIAGDDGEPNPLSLSFVALHPVSATDLSLISRVTSMGMPLTCLELHALDSTEFDTELWGGFLKDHITSPPGSGTQQLSFDTGEISTSGMETLCWAVAHSQSLREVDFAFGSHDNDFERWLWLVYALFSKESDHDIHTVSLNMETLDAMSYVEAMQSVLSHDDPVACLYEYLQADDFEEIDEVDVPSTASIVVLKPSATVNRGSSTNDEQAHELVTSDPCLAYRVVRNRPDEECIDFVLPGMGICWTDRRDVLEMRSVVTGEEHSVRHLKLHEVNQDGNPQAVVAFLELIGEPVERLTLYDLQLEGDASNEFFDAMLASFPNLKRLDLVDCQIENLDFLLRNTSRLESLRLDKVSLHEEEGEDQESRSWARVVEALSDPTHSLASSLVEFQVESTIATPESIITMLQRNKRLRRCDIVDEARSFLSSSGFLAHDGEALPGRLGPVPPAKTLAFLSVATGVSSDAPAEKKAKSTPTTPLAQYKLNNDSLSLILELAALTPRRTCNILHY